MINRLWTSLIICPHQYFITGYQRDYTSITHRIHVCCGNIYHQYAPNVSIYACIYIYICMYIYTPYMDPMGHWAWLSSVPVGLVQHGSELSMISPGFQATAIDRRRRPAAHTSGRPGTRERSVSGGASQRFKRLNQHTSGDFLRLLWEFAGICWDLDRWVGTNDQQKRWIPGLQGGWRTNWWGEHQTTNAI